MFKRPLILFGLTTVFCSFSSFSSLAIPGETIPVQFSGKWGDYNCLSSGDVHIDDEKAPKIQIDAKSVGVMDMHCELSKVKNSYASVFFGEFSCTSEGESSDSLVTLSLDNGNLSYSISGTPYGFGSGLGDLLQHCE